MVQSCAFLFVLFASHALFCLQEAVEAFRSAADVDSSLQFRRAVWSAWRAVGVTHASVSTALRCAAQLTSPSRESAGCALLQDLIDCASVDDCAQVFDVLEDQLDFFATVVRADARNRVPVLTAVLELYRLTSPERHALFRFRLQRWLAGLLPPFDKSLLNLKQTPAGLQGPNPAAADASTALELVSQLDDSKALTLDYALFAAFWKLQQIMGAGASSMPAVATFNSFVTACEAVLAAISAARQQAKSYPVSKSVPASDEVLSYFKDPEVLLAHFSPELDRKGHFKLQVLLQLSFYLSTLTRNNTPAVAKQVTVAQGLLKRVLSEVQYLSKGEKRELENFSLGFVLTISFFSASQ